MRIPALILAAASLSLAAGAALAQKTQLLVYTALETDQLKAYTEGFNKVYPNIDIKWTIDPQGNVMLRYPNDPDARRVLKDLEHLLRLSRVG